MALTVFGIDPGTRRTGWGVIRRHGNRLEHLGSGTIVAVGESMADRLRSIGDELDLLLARHRPDAVAIEGIFHHRNSQSALKLGQARGVAVLCAARGAPAIFEYAPAQVKQALGCGGQAPKEQVQAVVKMLLGLGETLGLDQSDALAIAICHSHAAPAQRLTKLATAAPADNRLAAALAGTV